MNKHPSRPVDADASAPSGALPKRRQLVVGAGVAAGAALAAATLKGQVDAAPAAAEARQDPAAGGGYRLTDHIRRYYDTTRS
jgi:hypothetical protein